MRIAVVPASVAIGALYFADTYAIYAVSGFIVAIALYRAAYWVPYQTDLGHFLGHKHIGIHMAIYRNVLQIMNAITPLVGGLLITAFEFKYVFVFAAIILFTTLLPIHYIVQVYERYSWGYIETFKHFLSRKNRALVYAYMADGAQGIITSIVWPIFIFELLNGNYASVGFITSLTTIAILLLNVVVGKIIDKTGRDKVLKYSTLFSATGWLIKVFVDSAFQIFITDTYHRIGRAANRMTFDSSTYEQAADNGHYIDEFTTLKNMALDLGRVLMLIIVVVLVYSVGNVRIVFILAAIATLMMVFLNRRISVR
jgi:MFS family permease